MTVTEPQQLTLWPDDALPGQLPLFNRKAAFLASRQTLLMTSPPTTAEPLWGSRDGFGKRPPMDVVPAAAYL